MLVAFQKTHVGRLLHEHELPKIDFLYSLPAKDVELGPVRPPLSFCPHHHLLQYSKLEWQHNFKGGFQHSSKVSQLAM